MGWTTLSALPKTARCKYQHTERLYRTHLEQCANSNFRFVSLNEGGNPPTFENIGSVCGSRAMIISKISSQLTIRLIVVIKNPKRASDRSTSV